MAIEGTATSRRERDLRNLRTVLRRMTFPARQDDILGLLVAGRCPSSLLWRVGRLSRERLYRSADEVCAELAGSEVRTSFGESKPWTPTRRPGAQITGSRR